MTILTDVEHMRDSEQPSELMFPRDYKGVLSLEEIAALCVGKSLCFKLDNLSYKPSKDYIGSKPADKWVAESDGKPTFWLGVNAEGELRVNREGNSLYGKLIVNKILGDEYISPERYLASSFRPWNGESGRKEGLRFYEVKVDSKKVRMHTKDQSVADCILFYENDRTDPSKHSFEVKCLRESRILL